MNDDLALTLKAVGMAATVPSVVAALGWPGHVTAINNRLEQLRKLSLVSRKRIGRNWLYIKK